MSLEAAFNYGSQTIYTFAHICVTAGEINSFVSIGYHERPSSRNKTTSYSPKGFKPPAWSPSV